MVKVRNLKAVLSFSHLLPPHAQSYLLNLLDVSPFCPCLSVPAFLSIVHPVLLALAEVLLEPPTLVSAPLPTYSLGPLSFSLQRGHSLKYPVSHAFFFSLSSMTLC
jgi:hypothetical protein